MGGGDRRYRGRSTTYVLMYVDKRALWKHFPTTNARAPVAIPSTPPPPPLVTKTPVATKTRTAVAPTATDEPPPYPSHPVPLLAASRKGAAAGPGCHPPRTSNPSDVGAGHHHSVSGGLRGPHRQEVPMFA